MPGLRGDQVTATAQEDMRIVSCPGCGRIACQASGRVMIKCAKCATWFAENEGGEMRVLKEGNPKIVRGKG